MEMATCHRGKTENRLMRLAGKAVQRFRLIEAGDRVMVAVSGGKDSLALLWILRNLQRRAPIHFDLLAIHVDQHTGSYPKEHLSDFFEREGFEYLMVDEPAGGAIERLTKEGANPCSVCARLRRGILYTQMKKTGCTKLALGHHRDDLAATLLMNLLFTSQIKSMPPKLLSDDGACTVIRPFVYVSEKDTRTFAHEMKFPVVEVNCPYQEHLEQGERAAVGRLLADLDARYGEATAHVAAALGRVIPTHLMDETLYNFKGITNRENQLRKVEDL